MTDTRSTYTPEVLQAASDLIASHNDQRDQAVVLASLYRPLAVRLQVLEDLLRDVMNEMVARSIRPGSEIMQRASESGLVFVKESKGFEWFPGVEAEEVAM